MGGLAIAGVLAVAAGCGRLGFNEPPDACADSCAHTGDAHPGDGPAGDATPTGTYAITPAPIAYSCAAGLVNISFTQLAFADTGTALTVTSNDTGAPAQPCPMTGATASAGHIDVTCTLTGSCNETYSLVGDFTAPTAWSGTFSASYAGGMCLNCTAQTFAITGTR